MTGGVEPLRAVDGAVAVAFEPYGSQLIVLRNGAGAAPPPRSPGSTRPIAIDAGWTVAFAAGPESPIALPHSWTDQPGTRFFSGTATYRSRVTIDPLQRGAAARVLLDFGAAVPVGREALPGGTMRGNSFAALLASPVRDAATVFVNGRRAGAVWAPPYRVDISGQVRDGANDLRVDVYNTAINQLAEGGRLPDVDAVTERYGQRFRLQDVENLQPIPSGLLAVPQLLIER